MPAPRKKIRETRRKYASRLIGFYVREGYPRKQAVAIGLRTAKVPRRTRTRGSR